MTIVQQIQHSDIKHVAQIHEEEFPNDGDKFAQSQQWIYSKFLGWPVNRYYIAVNKDEIIGYILYTEIGGFRKNCVLELEQLAVAKVWQNQGVGTQLIDESLIQVASILANEKRNIKLVEMTTGVTNEVQRLYNKTLGAVVECRKKEFFDEDEVVMIARHSSINSIREKRGLPLIPLFSKVKL